MAKINKEMIARLLSLVGSRKRRSGRELYDPTALNATQ